MNTKVETINTKLDIAKLGIALIVVVAGIAAFYAFPEQSLLLRVVGILVAAGIAIGISLQTEKGRNTWAFIQDAQVEVRRVVWPTKEETMQTTLIVLIVVLLVSLLLWGLDWVLGELIGYLLGRGG